MGATTGGGKSIAGDKGVAVAGVHTEMGVVTGGGVGTGTGAETETEAGAVVVEAGFGVAFLGAALDLGAGLFGAGTGAEIELGAGTATETEVPGTAEVGRVVFGEGAGVSTGELWGGTVGVLLLVLHSFVVVGMFVVLLFVVVGCNGIQGGGDGFF